MDRRENEEQCLMSLIQGGYTDVQPSEFCEIVYWSQACSGDYDGFPWQ